MKVYIWKNVDGLTDNYHSGGGLVVVAASLVAARALVNEQTALIEAHEAAHDAFLKERSVRWGSKTFGERSPEERVAMREEYRAWTEAHPPPRQVCKGCVDSQEPDIMLPVDPLYVETRPMVLVFPDAGCC